MGWTGNDCKTCNGTGEVMDSDTLTGVRTCAACNGTGEEFDFSEPDEDDDVPTIRHNPAPMASIY